MKKLTAVGGGHLAFLIVVAASYISAITAIVYTRRPVPPWQAAVLVSAAVAYLFVGTYGFSLCRPALRRATA